MVAMCENDKDRFIKLLDILDQTYFGNVISLNKYNELFKEKEQLSKAALAAKEAEEKLQQLAEEVKQATALIDTSDKASAAAAPKVNEEVVKVEVTAEPELGKSDPDVPIKMIKSLIKLLSRNVNPTEKSAFDDEQVEQESGSPYNIKQLQQLWSITLESIKFKTV